MVENNSLEGCVNSLLEYTVGHGYGDCLVPAGPPLARIASERDGGGTFFARPIDEREGGRDALGPSRKRRRKEASGENGFKVRRKYVNEADDAGIPSLTHVCDRLLIQGPSELFPIGSIH